MANYGLDDLPYKVQKYIKKYASSYLSGCMLKAKELLSERMKNGISRFYEGYNPKFYNRTDYLANPSHVFLPISKTSDTYGEYYGGIRVNPRYFEKKAYKHKGASMSDIYKWTVYHGNHGIKKSGYNAGNYITTTPSPLDWTVDYLHSSTFIRAVQRAGRKATKNISL